MLVPPSVVVLVSVGSVGFSVSFFGLSSMRRGRSFAPNVGLILSLVSVGLADSATAGRTVSIQL